MSMTLRFLLLVPLALVILLVLILPPFLFLFILLGGAIGYVVANFTTLIALPLLVYFLVLVTIVLFVLVATLHDSLEALDEHGNILIFIIGTIFFTCGRLNNNIFSLASFA